MRAQGAVIFLAFALFVVWEERQGAWSTFLKAATGQYIISGSRTSSGSGGGIVGGIEGFGGSLIAGPPANAAGAGAAVAQAGQAGH
jgi:hypothetical protein